MKYLLTVSFVICASVALAQKPQRELVKDHYLYTVLPTDAIPAIDRPEMVDAKAADEFMRDQELVIGVAGGGEARAYSTWHLDHHEIVNDFIGETPIAVSW